MHATTTANNATSALDVMTANLHKLETLLSIRMRWYLASWRFINARTRVKEETVVVAQDTERTRP